MGKYDDFDSDDAATGERNYKSSSMRSSTQKTSILKNSPFKKNSQFSDDDDEDDKYNSGRLSNRNRYDSPLNSNRSDATSAKPPSGRLQPLTKNDSKGSSEYSSSKKASNSYSSYDSKYDKENGSSSYDPFKSKSNLPAITYTPPSNKSIQNDSDDSITDRYNKFTKRSGSSASNYDKKFDKYDSKYDSKYESNYDSKYDTKDSKLESKYDRFSSPSKGEKDKYDKYDSKYDSKIDSKYDSKFDSKFDSKYDLKTESKYDSKYDSKFETKYDTYDEEDLKKSTSSKFYRSDGPLKSATSKLDKLEDLDELYSKPSGTRNRSNSLDRLNTTSAYNNVMGSTFPGAKLQKFSSTSNVNGNDDRSDRSYTINSLNSTTMSVREAKNRSYLVGSLSAINGKGLLSYEEIDRNLMDRKAKVLISSWNMGGIKKLPINLEELVLPDTIQTLPDVYVIGVQEFDLNQKNWEISLQEQIGPTHVKLSSFNHGSIGITLFIRRELIWFCSVVEFEYIPFRAVNGPARTKGSVLISFQLFGTLLCFICSHFAAGEGNIDQRIDNYKSTINNIKLPKKLLTKNRALSTDATENFDTVFWFGDFNFLITKEREKVEKKVTHLRERRGNNYEDITNHDELSQAMTQDKAFKNFLEGRITFEPTYKYDINTDNYDTSDKCRIPSYTDRILYRTRQKGGVSCSYYDAIKELKLSDHRPVFGLYECAIRPGVDKVPLSYGDFDREVYAAGYQKRKMFRALDVGFENDKSSKNSPCVIQ